ncbi:MAG: hypothetical protein H6724_11675 [Sandaracinus sp.]|nr:hypothetical protein [Sandaracinus sp.]MCB9620093.1 hypothetical protein [Sandaracinus sp.]
MLRRHLLFCFALLAACGGDDDVPSRGEGSPCETATDCEAALVCLDGRCRARPDANVVVEDGGMECAAARVCGETCCAAEEICGGGSCCRPTELCGGVCCGGADQACVADRCVLDCGAREACGEGAAAACCAEGDLCYLGACRTPGAVCTRTTDCEDGEYCEATVGRCLPRATEGEACEYMPPVEELRITEEWHWPPAAGPAVFATHDQVMMAPMVANLTDDDGDGDVDRDDVPDVVFHTFTGNDYWGNGILRAVSGDDGRELWPAPGSDPGYRTTPGGEVAIGELVAESPGPEIAACSFSVRSNTPGHLLLIAADGSLLRRFDTAPNDVPCGFDAPALADLDGDGTPEIVVRYLVAHADGTVRRLSETTGATFPYLTVANVDADPDLEIVGGDRAYDPDGTLVWIRDGSDGEPALGSGYVAIADLDLDGDPELIRIGGGKFIMALDARTGATLWGPIDINPPEMAAVIASVDAARPSPGAGGGPPTIANFDDDPNPEIAFAGGFAYVIFEHDGTRKWYRETVDRSSRQTGSSIFDFEGDGVAEVLYNDERSFRVYRGPDGVTMQERCSTSGTLREYPIVVDVDNDDHAEVVLMSNNYAFTCSDGSPSRTGITVFGHPDNQWVRTRRIWNQHTYHVTNVDEDGRIPAREANNWTTPGLNNFRQNVQPDGLFDAPDLVLVDLNASTAGCPTEIRLTVRVLNAGRSGAPAGIPVTFYDVTDARTRLGRVTTTRALLPGESELVTLVPPFAVPAGMTDAIFQFAATVNAPDDEPLGGLNECRPANNDAGPIDASCPLID